MSQITRCPACATQFKVVPDQLRISDGWVRCGQCKQVFDALAHLMVLAQPDLLPPMPVGRTDGKTATPPAATPAARSAAPRVPGVTLSQQQAVPDGPAASDTMPRQAPVAPVDPAASPMSAPVASGPAVADAAPAQPLAVAPAPAEIPAYLAKGAPPLASEPAWTLSPASRDPWRDQGLPRSLPSSALPPGPLAPVPDPASLPPAAPSADLTSGRPPAVTTPSARRKGLEPAAAPASTPAPAPVSAVLPVAPEVSARPTVPPPVDASLAAQAPASRWQPPADLEPLPPIEMPELAPAPQPAAACRQMAAAPLVTPSSAEPSPPAAPAQHAQPQRKSSVRAQDESASADALAPADPALHGDSLSAAEGLVPDDPPPEASVQSTGASRRKRRPKVDAAAEDTESAESPDEAVDVGFVRAARRQAFWRRPLVRLVLSLMGLSLATLLAGQIAVHERDRIAALDPRTRPWLQALCEPLGCQIEPLRDINAVVIDSSSFTKGRGDSYQLAMAVKNRAAHAVATPAIELTLTDAQDQPVLRKVLTPQDMLAPPELPARGEWNASVGVVVTTGGARVAGYRMLVFYP